jgi:hypothetical protein
MNVVNKLQSFKDTAIRKKSLMNLMVRKCDKSDFDLILTKSIARDRASLGLLSPYDFKRAIQKIEKPEKLSTYDLDKIFTGADPEKINYRSFLSEVKQNHSVLIEERLWTIFSKFKKEDRALISLYAIKILLTEVMKIDLNDDEILERVNMITKKNEKGIGFDQFVMAMQGLSRNSEILEIIVNDMPDIRTFDPK